MPPSALLTRSISLVASLAALCAASEPASEPASVEDLIGRAKLAARVPDAAGADKLLVEAQALAPSNAEAALLRGNVAAFLLQDAVAAEAHYVRTLQLEARWDAHFFLGKVQAQQQHWTDAASSFAAANSLQPANPAPIKELAAAWQQLGSAGAESSWDSAHAALHAAAVADSHAPTALLELARLAAKLGRAPEAHAAYANLTALHSMNAAHILEWAEWRLTHPAEATGSGGGEAGMCDLLDAAEALEPGGRRRPELRQACSRQTPPRPSAAETAAAKAFADGGVCAMLAHFPTLAARASAAGGRCVVTLEAGSTVALVPTHPREGGGGVLVEAGGELEVVGGEGPTHARLDALGLQRHFLLAGGRLTLRRVELTGGRALLSGGGAVLALRGSELLAEAVRFVRNRAVFGSGGAIAARLARVELRDTSFEANSATLRGGALALSGGAEHLVEGVLGDGADADGEAAPSAGSKLKVSRLRAAAGPQGAARAAAAAAEAVATRVTWRGSDESRRNRAGRGGDDVLLCAGAQLTTPDAASTASSTASSTAAAAAAAVARCGEASGPEEEEQRRVACGLGGVRLLALEALGEGMELLEISGVEAHAIDLLRLATRADPASATAFSALFSSLYRHGEDAAAAQSIAAFERAAPHSPMLASSRATLRHQTGAMTLMRAQTLHTQVTRLRQGRPAAVPYADRFEAEAAAVDAFLRAAVQPAAQGDLWYELGTSLFFAGELAEAARVYAHGLTRAPHHKELQAEAAKATAFAGAHVPPTAAAAAALAASSGGGGGGGGEVATFTDADFKFAAMPPGAYAKPGANVDVQRNATELFGEAPTVYVSRAALLSRATCKGAIEAAEVWAAAHGGWTTARHYTVATTDVPMTSLPALLPQFNEALRTQLFPALASRYPDAAPDPAGLRVLDAFLVKYHAGAQASLPLHSDQSILSFTIALNDPAEYEGGGTWFRGLGMAIDAAAAGHVVMFPGKLEHAGHPITSGTRYVIVLFCGYDSNLSGRPNGWVMQRFVEIGGKYDGGAPAADARGPEKDEL